MNSAWQRYRSWSRWRWFLGLGFVPVVFAIATVQQAVFGSDFPFLVVGFVWYIAWVIAHFRAVDFACPRCGRTYFRGSWGWYNLFRRKCIHCGSPKWAEP